MRSDHHEQGYLLTGLLIGGSIGAIATLLFASKCGKELRSDLKEKGQRTLKEAEEFYSDSVEKAARIMKDARERARALLEEGDRQFSDARTKISEIFSCAQKKQERAPLSTAESLEETAGEA